MTQGVEASEAWEVERSRRARIQRSIGMLSLPFLGAAMVVSFVYINSFGEGAAPGPATAICCLVWLVFLGLMFVYFALEPPFRGEIL